MKVLFVVTNADLAGAPIHVLELAKYFSDKEIKIEVVFGEIGPVKDQINSLGIKTHCISTMRSNINPLNDFLSFHYLNKIVSQFQPDIIHCHSSKAGLISRLSAIKSGVPVVYTVHGWGFGPGRRRLVSILVQIVESFFANKTDKYIAVSNADRNIGINNLNIPTNAIETVYNGISFNPSCSNYRPIESVLVMVARNDHQKDYATFFKALRNASFSKALVIGRGTDVNNFKYMAKHLAGDKYDKVQFLGERSDIESIFEEASIFVLSSRFEGLPISIIEAMSKGLPIIASNVGGVSELVTDSYNGFLIRPGDSSLLGDKISYLTNNIEVRRTMGSRSLEIYLSKFTAETMGKRIHLIYKNLQQ